MRLEWQDGVCTNSPTGWAISVISLSGEHYWKAEQNGGAGALYMGATVTYASTARRTCEVALLRLGVLEPESDWLNAADVLLVSVGSRDANDRRRAVVAVAHALAALEVEGSHV